MITKDFHVHESHSPDARRMSARAQTHVSVKDYVRMAEEKGIDEIGFATHFTISGPFADRGIPVEQIPEYFEEILTEQKSTSVKLRIGLEVDYIADEEKHLSKILDEYPFDFILGSIHYVGNNYIATKRGFENFLKGRSILEGIDEYFHLWKKAIETGLFDVMAHPDYFRRAIYRMDVPFPSFKEYEASALNAIDSLKSYDVGVEVNSTGWTGKRGIGDGYPTIDFLKAVNKSGVSTITVGSDSHYIDELCVHFDKAVKRLEDGGYNYFCVFKNRKSTKIYLKK